MTNWEIFAGRPGRGNGNRARIREWTTPAAPQREAGTGKGVRKVRLAIRKLMSPAIVRARRNPRVETASPCRRTIADDKQVKGNWPLRIVTEQDPISLAELRSLAQTRFGDLAKAVVDIRRGIMLVDADLHSDDDRESRERIADLVSRFVRRWACSTPISPAADGGD